MSASIPYEIFRRQHLQNDEMASHYLRESLVDSDLDLFKSMLNDLADARVGGIEELSARTGLSREELYGTFTDEGTTRESALKKIRSALRLQPVADPEDSRPLARASG